jgi:hypothetical protein
MEPITGSTSNDYLKNEGVNSFSEMNGIAWDCVGKKAAPQGGFIYEFRFNEDKRKTLNDFDEAAIEPLPEDEFLFEKFNKLSFLGYEKKDDRLYCPDKEALLNGWSKEFPERELKILDSNEIFSHIDFVQGYIDHDVIFSNQKEFVHDQIFHLAPTLNLMVDAYDEYKKEKKVLPIL